MILLLRFEGSCCAHTLATVLLRRKFSLLVFSQSPSRKFRALFFCCIGKMDDDFVTEQCVDFFQRESLCLF